MSKTRQNVRYLCCWNPRDELRAAERRAVGIRKLLARLKRFLPRGVMGDAEQLARSIERLARHGQRCKAADAIEIASRIDALAAILGNEVDGLLAL